MDLKPGGKEKGDASPTDLRAKAGEPCQWGPTAGWYLRLRVLFVLVVVELLRPQHEVSLLPVLHDGPLLPEPAHLDGPLQRVGGGRLVEGGHLLAGHHTLGPSYGEEQTGRLAEGHEAASGGEAGGRRGHRGSPRGPRGWLRPSQAGSGGQACGRKEAPSGREAAERPAPGAGRPGTGKPATARGPTHTQSGARRQPRHSAKRKAGWSLLKRKWPQHLTKGASFFLRGSRYLTRERENGARSEGSGSPTQLQRQPEAGRALSPEQDLAPRSVPPQQTPSPRPAPRPHRAGRWPLRSAPAQCHPLPLCPWPSERIYSPLCSTGGLTVAAFLPRDLSGGPFPALTTHKDPMENASASRTQKGNLNPDPHVFTPERCCHQIRSRCPQLLSRVTPSPDSGLLSFPPQQWVCRPVVRLDMSSEPHLLSFPASSIVPFYRGPPHGSTKPRSCAAIPQCLHSCSCWKKSLSYSPFLQLLWVPGTFMTQLNAANFTLTSFSQPGWRPALPFLALRPLSPVHKFSEPQFPRLLN